MQKSRETKERGSGPMRINHLGVSERSPQKRVWKVKHFRSLSGTFQGLMIDWYMPLGPFWLRTWHQSSRDHLSNLRCWNNGCEGHGQSTGGIEEIYNLWIDFANPSTLFRSAIDFTRLVCTTQNQVMSKSNCLPAYQSRLEQNLVMKGRTFWSWQVSLSFFFAIPTSMSKVWQRVFLQHNGPSCPSKIILPFSKAAREPFRFPGHPPLEAQDRQDVQQEHTSCLKTCRGCSLFTQ